MAPSWCSSILVHIQCIDKIKVKTKTTRSTFLWWPSWTWNVLCFSQRAGATDVNFVWCIYWYKLSVNHFREVVWPMVLMKWQLQKFLIDYRRVTAVSRHNGPLQLWSLVPHCLPGNDVSKVKAAAIVVLILSRGQQWLDNWSILCCVSCWIDMGVLRGKFHGIQFHYIPINLTNK